MRSLQDCVRHLWLPESLAGLRYLVRLGGSCGPSVSAMRFSLPGMPSSSGTSGSLRSGFYSPYFIVPEKSSGLRTILDLQVLNRALHKLPFKMLTQKGIFGCVRPLDWFAAIDLKDACFHVYILPRHSLSRDSCSRVGHISTRSCLLGYPCCLASSPKSWRWPLFPWENGVCASSTTSTTGSYLQSLTSSCAHTGTWCSGTSASWVFGSTGKREIFSRHGVGFGQPEYTPHPGSCSIGAELPQDLSGKTAVPLKLFQKLLGHMASATAIVPLGLLHMSAPLQLWLHGQVPRWARKRGTHQVQNTPACRTTFSPWTDLSFLRAGVPQEQVSRHSVVFTDASATSWGAMYNGHAVSGVWTGPQLRRHINCLELLAVRIALRRLRGQGRSGPYRQHDDRCIYQLARWFTLPSQLARLPTAEREGCLQAEDGPVYSGCHHLGLRSTRCALPAEVACSLY